MRVNVSSWCVSRSGGLAVLTLLPLAIACSGQDDGVSGEPQYGAPPTFGNGGTRAQSGPTAPSGAAAGASGGLGSGASGSEGMGGSLGLGSEQPGGMQPDGASAGAPGQGGVSGSTGSAGSAGSGGSGAQPGAGGAEPAEPPPDTPANGDCPGLFFCDGFEGASAGGPPNAALWQVIANYSPTPQSPNVQVSSENAHGGSRAVRVVAAQSRNGMVARLPAQRYFVRAWLQIDSAPLGPVFIGLGTDQSSETRLRLSNQAYAVINTVGPGDAVRPNEATTGNCPGCVTLTPNEWFCAEFFIDQATQSATLWIDDVQAAEIVNGQGGWPVQPASPALFLGSMGLQGGQTGVWIDDVAAGPERIGCD